MDPYIADWLNLLLRFVHLVTGIAWIGASFYFIWLDNHLREPPRWKLDEGIKGDLWAIHGGGFYEVSKYQLAPPVLPETLHWFKWEAYSTWISGFLLLCLMYYIGAESYLIDPGIAELTAAQAIAIGLGVIVGGWFVYDFLCGLDINALLLGCVLLLLLTGLAFVLNQLFSARGAYIHIGAVVGTIMVGNVFRVIIPSQKALVAAVEEGTSPDPTWAARAKLRSTHNTYATLPVLFIMISNHYPVTYNHHHGWLVLTIIILITAATRWYFVLRHHEINKPVILVAAVVATIALAFALSPKARNTSPAGDTGVKHAGRVVAATDMEKKGRQIIRDRCVSCHSDDPDDAVFRVAPSGVKFDNDVDIKRWGLRIKARAFDTRDMPLMNKTQMTDDERRYLSAWLTGDTVQAQKLFLAMLASKND